MRHARSGFRLGRLRHAIPALLLLLPLLGTVEGKGGRGIASFRPTQSVVLDGSTTAEDAYHVSFGKAGYEMEALSPAARCPRSDHEPEEGVIAVGPEGASVFQTFAAAVPFQAYAAYVSGELPPHLAALVDDCDVAANFADVLVYLAQVQNNAEQLLTQVQNCHEDVLAAYCEALHAIEDAPSIVGEQGGIAPPFFGGGGGGSSGALPSGCTRFRSALNLLAQRLNALRTARSMCVTAHGDLTAFVPILDQLISEFGGITDDQRAALFLYIDGWLQHSEHNVMSAEALVAEIDGLVASFTLEEVEASCALCPSQTAFVQADSSTGAVSVRTRRQPLGRYVGALHRAANAAQDPAQARRIAGLADRIAKVPGSRVLHVTYRGTAAIGHEFVALRASDAVGDPSAPLAVVITVLADEAPLPARTPEEDGLLFDVFRTFQDTLRPRVAR